MSENFYRAFEDRYRGSRELIKSRLMAYQPFFEPLAAARPDQRPVALDLGCGRGEWLELLTEHGFAAHGVDLDEGMLAACRERQLDVELTDALSALRALPDTSVALVSAFHLVEHIAFDQVQGLIAEALRVLQPGGLLIMETPNPENLVVGASSFYMDPSHLRPLPAPLLDFVVGYSGFARHKIVRLQEAAQLHTDAPIGLINVLDGVSPDYAVVGQKAAPATALARFDAPFALDYGIGLGQLAQRYEVQEERRRAELHLGLARLDQHVGRVTAVHQESLDSVHKGVARVAAGVEDSRVRIDHVLQRLGPLEQLARLSEHVLDVARQDNAALAQRQADVERRMAQTDAGNAEVTARHDRLEALAREAEARSQQAEVRSQQAELRSQQAEQNAVRQHQQIEALLNSSSWRITAPLRALAGGAYRVRSAARDGRLGSGVKRRLKGPLLDLMRAVLRRPRLKRAARTVLARFPALQARLYGMLQHASHVPAPAASAPPPAPASVMDLSPRALRIYHELKQSELKHSLEARKD